MGFIYVGGETTKTVQKLKKLDLVKTAESASYGGIIYALAEDDDFIYAGGATTKTVQKLQKSNLTKVAESISYGLTIEGIAVDDKYVYAGGWTTQKVWKLFKSNLEKFSESIDYGGAILELIEDDNFIYCAGYTTQKVWKLRKSDLEKVAESINYGGTIYALAQDANFIYIGGETTNKVWKLQKSDLTKVAESIAYGWTIRALTAEDSNFVYAGGVSTQKVWKLQKSDMAKVAESVDYGGTILALTEDNNFIYAGGITTKTVWKLRKSDLAKEMESTSYGGTIRALTEDEEAEIPPGKGILTDGDLIHLRETQSARWVEEPSIIPNKDEYILLVSNKEFKVAQSRTFVDENDLVKFYNTPSLYLARGIRAEPVYKGFKFDFYFDSWIDGYYWTHLFSNVYQWFGNNWSLINSFAHYSESFTKDIWHTAEENISMDRNFPELFKIEFGIESYSVNSLHYCVRLDDVYLLKSDGTYELIPNGNFETGSLYGWGAYFPENRLPPHIENLGSPHNFVCRVKQVGLAESYTKIWNPSNELIICYFTGTIGYWLNTNQDKVFYTCVLKEIGTNEEANISMNWNDWGHAKKLWVAFNGTEIFSCVPQSYSMSRSVNISGCKNGDTIEIWLRGGSTPGNSYIQDGTIKRIY